MDATVLVAALGFAATLAGAFLGARLQREVNRETQVLQSKLEVYKECSTSLYELRRLSYNRAKARIQGIPEKKREPLRQAAYAGSSRARSAIGLVNILVDDQRLSTALEHARRAIRAFDDVDTAAQLGPCDATAKAAINSALEAARTELAR
jgi:hypothetical protein